MKAAEPPRVLCDAPPPMMTGELGLYDGLPALSLAPLPAPLKPSHAVAVMDAAESVTSVPAMIETWLATTAPESVAEVPLVTRKAPLSLTVEHESEDELGFNTVRDAALTFTLAAEERAIAPTVVCG